MHVLVLNIGSSSVKSTLINQLTEQVILEINASNILDKIEISSPNGDKKYQETGHKKAIELVLTNYKKDLTIDLVVHRVVHGGDKFNEATLISNEVIEDLKTLNHLAPLHNPNNITGIETAIEQLQNIPHYAVFDTAFHNTLPNRAKHYAIPKKWKNDYGIKRYGFHGASHQYVANQAAQLLETPIDRLKIITCHLGNGCSITAVEYGRSVETSMGMTPLEGLVMGTRSGDLDPGIIQYIAKKEHLSFEEVELKLNKESGLKGVSGLTNDMRTIIEKASEGNEDCRLAIHIFTHRLRKYIGAYATIMGGVDAIVFTGGIGENSSYIRHRATQRLDFLGAILDEDKNRDLKGSFDFSENHSRVKLLCIPTNESLYMANEAAHAHGKEKINKNLTIPVGVSARHVHLTQDAVDALFGKGHQLTPYKPLSQPGQFACNERVALVGPKNTIERVRILGPTRSKNQVEISRTDEFFLGIDAPIRASGHTEGSPGIKLVGDKGELTIKEGVICAWRHIHMTPNDALNFGVKDKDIVEVRIENNERPITFGNVLVRVKDSYALEMHIDTDEGNAAELNSGDQGVLTMTNGEACLIRRK